jgi:hypothetical protein
MWVKGSYISVSVQTLLSPEPQLMIQACAYIYHGVFVCAVVMIYIYIFLVA